MGLNDQFNKCLDDLGDIGPYQVYCFRIKCTEENMFEIIQREEYIGILQTLTCEPLL